MKVRQPRSNCGQLSPAAAATATRASSPAATRAIASRSAAMPPTLCRYATAFSTSAKASVASSADGSLAMDGCIASKLMSRPDRKRLGQQVLHGRRDAATRRFAPAALEKLGQPLLQPDRRAVGAQGRDGVVDQLVVHAVQPGIASGQRARRGHHQPGPFAKRDGAGARDLGDGQRRDGGQVAGAAIELDPDRQRRIEPQVLAQGGGGGFDGVARVRRQHGVLGRVADHRVRRALFLELADGVARRFGQLREAARLRHTARCRRGSFQRAGGTVVVAGQELVIAVGELGLGRVGRRFPQSRQRRPPLL